MYERRRLAVGVIASVATFAAYAACGGGDDNAASNTQDASVSGDVSTNPSDANVSDGGNLDAGVCVGASCSGELLVADSAEGKIYWLETDGTVKKTITAPIPDVAGVTFDSREPTQLWIARFAAQDPVFYRLDFDGNVTSTRNLSPSLFLGAVDGGMHDLRYREAPDAADDFILCSMNDRTVTQVIAYPDASAAGAFSDRFFDGIVFEAGLWGVDVDGDLRSDDVGDASRWVTHNTEQDASTLERWSLSTGVLATTNLPTARAYGVALTPEHELYVVDAEHPRILHVDASGTLLNIVASPGSSPTGISYRP